MENFIIDFIVLIGLVILYFTLKNLLPSYFSEKGKNLAKKEDIEELTEKVEDVKQKFVEKTENLKARLDLVTQLQIGYKNEERTAVTRFHEAIFTWINMCLDSGHGGLDDYNNEMIDKRIFSFNNAYNKVLNTQAMLELYVEDKKLHETIFKLKTSVLENLSFHPTDCLIKIKHINQDLIMLESITDPDERSSKHSGILEKRSEAYKEFRSSILKGYSMIIEEINNYQDTTRQYLQGLIDKDK